MSVILRFTVICLCVAAVACQIYCPPNYCGTVNCSSEVPETNKPPCGENQVFNQQGTICGCCATCVIQLGEGAYCGHLWISDGPPALSVCGTGLECTEPSGTNTGISNVTCQHQA